VARDYDRKAKLDEIRDLACSLIRNGAVSTPGHVRFEGIEQSFALLCDELRQAGLNALSFTDGGRYPAVYCDAGPPGSAPRGELLLAGHYDVVLPQAESQLEPVVDGEWLRGRGSADMLTVAATLVVFMRDLCVSTRAARADAPKIGLLLVGNEEPGEAEPWGTPHVLESLEKRFGYRPKTLIAGERTGDGPVPAGVIESRQRGLIRLHVEARGEAGHTALAKTTVTARILSLYRELSDALAPSEQSWKTTLQLSYVSAGIERNFNIAAREASAGIEIRPAFDEHTDAVRRIAKQAASALGLDVTYVNNESAVSVDPTDPRVRRIVDAAAAATGATADELVGAGKLPATQARFAPEGCAPIVWGQSGVGPHAPDEAHYLPSVLPYYDALWNLA